ncbi:MAG: tetratricopeptide repeat protein [Methylococcales bacterium]|nr:tetratricopeptide repeat protein [Methylococcales bacterium]
MKTKQIILRNLGIAILTIGMTACNGPEERKAKYKEEGRQYLQAGDYDKASLAFRNVQQIDPKDWENHFLIGEVLSKQGKLEAAFREYSLVVNQDPANVMARIRVGQIMLMSHHVDQAEKMVDEALEKQPDNVEALVLKAGVQSSKNDNDSAIVTIEKALQINPDDIQAILMQGSIYAKLNKLDQAIELLKAAIDKHPENTQLLSMLGGFYVRKHMLPEAEATLATIIKVDPDDVQHYKSLALFQVATNQVDKAEATLREAVQKLPDNETAKTNLIDFLVEKRSPDMAIAELLPMVEKNPQAYDLKFKLANLQMSKKDAAGAEQTLKEVVEQDKLGPAGIRARDKLAAIYVLTRRMDEAKALVKEVLEANPRDNDGLSLRGEFALMDHKAPEAIADFRSVLVDQPNNIAVLKMLAAAHMMNNEDTLAKENLEKVVAAAPKDEAAWLDLAGLYMKVGQKDQAKQQIENLLKNYPDSLKGQEAMFKIALAEKQWDKAQDVAKQIQQLYSKDAVGWYMSGLGYQAAKKYEPAAEAFQQALQKKPDAIEPLNELIKCYMELKQPEKALEKLQHIVKQMPNHVVAYNLMGGVYLVQQKFSEAKAAFLKTEELKPDWFAPYRSLAVIDLAQKNKDAAIAVLTKGIEKTKGSLELVVDLARIYRAAGEHRKVLALFEESYKLHPESVVVVNNLASYLAEYPQSPGDLERADKLAEPLLKSNNPALMDTVGWIAYKQGNYSKARDILSKVLEIEPRALLTHYHLGMTYAKLNDSANAIEHLQKVVNGKGSFDGMDIAKETLKKLQDHLL